ncbi:MAG: hypothetical protein FD181_1120 [Prolixibacteraceae bacterium]|nr:MAG: hypothetical protein FD181_1120 [Prolixibacteraceae bacterium]
MKADFLGMNIKAWVESGMICLLMSDNKKVCFPIELNSKLKNATVKQLKNIEIICGGTGLNWTDLDEDLSLTGIMEGRYGY